jgi:hypothetical protein
LAVTPASSSTSSLIVLTSARRADELGEVLVAGGDHHLPAGLDGLAGEGADHVVGLDALLHQQRPAFGLHRLVERLDLGPQVVGHRRAVDL